MAGSTPDHGDAERGTVASGVATDDEPSPDDWYRWGRVALYAEMLLAVLVTGFALYLAFTGATGVLP